jgi:hypothetical protein
VLSLAGFGGELAFGPEEPPPDWGFRVGSGAVLGTGFGIGAGGRMLPAIPLMAGSTWGKTFDSEPPDGEVSPFKAWPRIPNADWTGCKRFPGSKDDPEEPGEPEAGADDLEAAFEEPCGRVEPGAVAEELPAGVMLATRTA